MKNERICLAELREGDAELLTAWQWDPLFLANVSEDAFHPFQAENWQELFADVESNEQFCFTIRKVKDDELVGFVSLAEVQFKNRNAKLGIGIPWEGYRGLGYGKEALELILAFAFDHLGLHKVRLSVHSYNEPAIRLYEKVGFIREGINREGVFLKGQWLDQYDYGLLEAEWRAEKEKKAAD